MGCLATGPKQGISAKRYCLEPRNRSAPLHPSTQRAYIYLSIPEIISTLDRRLNRYLPIYLHIMHGFIHITDEATDFFQSVQNHSRFRLRAVAIIAASSGSILNFLLLFACILGDSELEPPRILTGCAYIPVCSDAEALTRMHC